MEIAETQNKASIDAIIDAMTLFDDYLMSHVFDQNIEATELLLSAILDRDIKVVRSDGQVELKNPKVKGRDITLDIRAIDVDGKNIDIEVQGNSAGANVHRARYHSSMLDSRMLSAGQDFKELKDSYVIFIYRHDKFRRGLPVYNIKRYVSETGESFDDGSHIIYVNGNYRGNDKLGKLLEDFRQPNPENIHYTELASGMKHFKETEKGRDQMSEAVEEYAKEYAEQKQMINIQSLMENVKFTLDQALDALGIQGEEREYIKNQLQKQ